VKLFPGLQPLYRSLLRIALRRTVRTTVVPEQFDALGLDRGKPIVYALQMQQVSTLLILDEVARQLGLPEPLLPLVSGAVQERRSFFFLTNNGQPTPLRRNPYVYSRRLRRLIDATLVDPSVDVQLVPVSVFWGRGPITRKETVIRALFADSWRPPGLIRQAIRVLLHGRETLVKFGTPIELRAAVAAGEPATAMRRVGRLLRGRFKRERELAVGPDLSHRHTVINNVVDSAPVQAAIAAEASLRGVPIEKEELRARRYAYEIASDYSYPVVRAFIVALTVIWNRIYDGVRVFRFESIEAIAGAGAGTGIVYVPCHRSHIDYLLLSFVIYRRGLQPPHIAAGSNLNLPVLGPLLRGGGAFYLRRSFRGQPLYAEVFTEYLHTVLRRGFPVKYFVEGGRSRTGRTLAPKAGMLAMTVNSFLRDHERPLAFVPVYIGYERLFEGDAYLAELAGKPKTKESLRALFATARKLRERWGTVYLNFGEPIRLDTFLDEKWPAWRDVAQRLPVGAGALAQLDDQGENDRREAIAELARLVVTRINEAVVINPVNLIAVVMLGVTRQAMDAELLAGQVDLFKRLLTSSPYSACQRITELDGAAVVAYAEDFGLLERVAHPLGDILQVPSGQIEKLGYFRNNVMHAFAMPALLACLIAQNETLDPPKLVRVARQLFMFLRAELFLSWSNEDLDARLAACVEALRALGLVRDQGALLTPPDPSAPESIALHALANIIRLPIERYVLAVATLVRSGAGVLSADELLDYCCLLAQRFALLHGTGGPEFCDRGALRAIIDTLIGTELVTVHDGRLHFSDTLDAIAHDAHYLLSADTRLAIAHAGQLAQARATPAAAAGAAEAAEAAD